MKYSKPARCPEDDGEFVEKVTEFEGKILRQCSTCTVRQWCTAEGQPTGTPANAFLRRARMQAHVWFDDLWRQGFMRRPEAYAWLQTAMESPVAVHMGELTTQECAQVVVLTKAKLRELQGR